MRRTLAVVSGLTVVVLGAAAAALAMADRGDAGQVADAGLPPATATVTRQTLADTRTVDGSLGYGVTATAASRAPGTVTYLPASGGVVKRGKPLVKIDNQPVILWYGAMPAYRALGPDDEGVDVKQVEQNLHALGYRGFTVDDEYTDATADAVEEWQEDVGLPETGRLALGQVLFAADAVRVDSLSAAVGDAVSPGAKLLSYSGTARAVTVDLEPADQRMARIGAAVSVELPDGAPVGGKVTAATTVIVPASGADQEPTTVVEVTVALDDPKKAADYALASVDVTFTAAEREDVLTVPVAALVALAEGGFGVEVVDGSSSHYVAVKTGLFSGGRVEVTADGIAEGTVVGVPA